MSFKIALQTVPLILLVLLAVAILIPACAPNPNTSARVKEYKDSLSKTSNATAGSKASIDAFTTFLQRLGEPGYAKEHTSKVYAKDAYLNDTIVTHHGPEEIQAYFEETAKTMTTYEVTTDQIVSSGPDHYVRWTMVFSAPKLNGGEPVESVGISHVRFNEEGKVIMHQDFWDSGTNIYGQIPVLGGAIETVRRRFE